MIMWSSYIDTISYSFISLQLLKQNMEKFGRSDGVPIPPDCIVTVYTKYYLVNIKMTSSVTH